MKKILVWLFFALATLAFLAPARAAELGESTAPVSAYQQRYQFEQRLLNLGLFVLPHKQNYILPLAYNLNPNNAPFEALGDSGGTVDKTEVKFQLSLKASLWRNPFGQSGDFFFAYTQLAFWQLYNKDRSSPFRDTNYEPEFFFSFNTHNRLGPLTNHVVTVGGVHQSNGREDPLSRSWNRVYASFLLGSGNFIMTVRPWYRLPEPAETDNNPDIQKYLGYGDLLMVYRIGKQNLSLLVRDNLRFNGDNKGALEFGYTFPLTSTLKGFAQIFDGYGESLIDYNHDNTRFSIGVALTDWL